MGLADDLRTIEIAARKARSALVASVVTAVVVSPDTDVAGETTVTLTAAQRQMIRNNADPFVAIIKATAAGLP